MTEQNCAMHGMNDQRITDLEKRMMQLESDMREASKRVSDRERDGAVMDTKLDAITEAIAKMEKSLEKIDKRLENLEKEKARSWDWIKYLVGGGVIMAIIQYIMQSLLK